MPLSSLNRASLVDQVIAQLHTLIESGEWPVGSRIPTEAELVDQFGTGRNTIREATRALGYAGMLESRQGDGTYVRACSDLGAVLRRRLQRSSLVEALEVRNSLEREAARFAASRHTSDDLATIRSALDAQRADLFGGDQDALVEADICFHRSIVTAAHNSVLADLYDHFTDALRASIAEAISPWAGAGVRIEEHVAIVDAIVAGDADSAERAAILHLAHSLQAVETSGMTDASGDSHVTDRARTIDASETSFQHSG